MLYQLSGSGSQLWVRWTEQRDRVHPLLHPQVQEWRTATHSMTTFGAGSVQTLTTKQSPNLQTRGLKNRPQLLKWTGSSRSAVCAEICWQVSAGKKKKWVNQLELQMQKIDKTRPAQTSSQTIENRLTNRTVCTTNWLKKATIRLC